VNYFKDILVTFLVGGALAIVLGLVSVMLVKSRTIHANNAKRFAAIAGALAASIGLFLTQRTGFAIASTLFDLGTFLAVLWVICFSLLWAVIATAINRYHAEGEFGESSMLSMMYLDSHNSSLLSRPAEKSDDYQRTQIMEGRNGRPRKK
jgi:hypothetical protein